MKSQKRSFLAVCAAGTAMAALCLAQNAQATFTVNITQQGANVVANGSGSINLGGLTLGSVSSFTPDNPLVWGALDIIALGPVAPADYYSSLNTGPTSFGSGGEFIASSSSGDAVELQGNAFISVPSGYTSGSALSNSATWDNTTIAGLGLTPGTHVWTWGTGADADSYTLNIGAVPEPSTYLAGAVMLLPLGLNALRRLRRKPTV